MALQARAAAAFSAMKAIGIPEKRVKPVLKNLLKVYDKSWDLIEDENYRILADSIFEFEAEEASKKEAELHDESPRPPLKRLRLKHQEDQGTSSSSETTLKRPKIEEGSQLSTVPFDKENSSAEPEPAPFQMTLRSRQKEVPSPLACATQESEEEPSQLNLRTRRNETEHAQTHGRDKGKRLLLSPQITHCPEIEEPQACLIDNRTDAESFPSPLHPSIKRKEHLPPQIAAREKESAAVRPPSAVCFKEPKIEPGIFPSPKDKSPNPYSLVTPKSEPFTGYYPQLEVPIAVIHPPDFVRRNGDANIGPAHNDGGSNGNVLTGNTTGFKSVAPMDKNKGASKTVNENGENLQLANIPETSASNFEIASSSSGEVKITLSYNHLPEQPEIHIPNLDAVLKLVEDKCLKSCRVIEPHISLSKLLQDLCQSFFDLSNDSASGGEERSSSSPHVSPNVDTSKKSSVEGADRGDGHDSFVPLTSTSNDSHRFRSPSETVNRIPGRQSLGDLDGIESSWTNQDVLGNNCERKEHENPTSSSLDSLAAVPGNNFSPDEVRPFHDVNDISRGEEKVRVSLVNEVSSEPYPPLFKYIPKNLVHQKAYVNFSLARIGDEDYCSNCFGDCLSSSIPCACARETGGEFAYTLEGLVKEIFLDECVSMNRDPQQHNHVYCNNCPLERSKIGRAPDPCKGHLVRKFIKECWSKCGCSKLCGNRVVQRGITCNLQVFFTSEGKGWGLRTLEDLPRGTFVCEYVGEILTNMELYKRNAKSKGEKHTYPVLLDADWGAERVLKDEEALCLDATHFGNVARFINHRCFDANLVEIPVEIETPDHHYYHLAFFTTRNVDALEELTWDYGIDFDDRKHPVKAFQCRCRSKCCRDMKRSHRTKGKALILG
ncbi:hypothetical protein Sjap_008589 [Stephania japonica]|uniref:Uncharacterized protein n=1 Tax=Stephania japonica TaxID=461633 RepID=A0AAP0PER9_9MAGN